MKVLLTVPRLDMPGGVSNYYRTLRGCLDADKVYLEIGSRPGETGKLRKLRRLLTDYWRFYRALSQGSFDLVHVNPSMDRYAIWRDALFILIAKTFGYPVVVHFRGWIPSVESAVRERFPALFRFAYGKADATIVLAEEFRRGLLQLGVPEPFFLETTVVGDHLFPAADSPVETTGRACNVLFLSRLDTGKGLPEAIRAFAVLQATRPQARLTIAGDGPDRKAAEREVTRLGLANVTFLGHVTGEVKDQTFQQADIYLFTSLAEGMPNSVLEAMAHGLPVVTRPVGGLRDFFEEGRMGFAPDSMDPAVFADALRRLANDPQMRTTMGAYNREYARQRFSASQVARRLLDIYTQVVAGARRAT